MVESGAKITCLENVGNIALLNGGRAVKILPKLFDKVGWATYLKVLHVRHYGDPTNKSHAFVIAISRVEYGDRAEYSTFPSAIFQTKTVSQGKPLCTGEWPENITGTTLVIRSCQKEAS